MHDGCVSLSGYVVGAVEIPRDVAVQTGPLGERWRFKTVDCGVAAPRASDLFGADPLADFESVLPAVYAEISGEAILDPSFYEVPCCARQESLEDPVGRQVL